MQDKLIPCLKKTASSPNINNVSDADQLELYTKIMNFMSRKSGNDCGMQDKFLAVAGDASDIVDVKNFLETYIHEDNNGDGASLGETAILTDCKSIMQSCEWKIIDWKEGSEHDWWKKNVARIAKYIKPNSGYEDVVCSGDWGGNLDVFLSIRSQPSYTYYKKGKKTVTFNATDGAQISVTYFYGIYESTFGNSDTQVYMDINDMVLLAESASGGGPPPTPVPGCTDPTAPNFDPAATTDDGSCVTAPTPGTDDSVNYNSVKSGAQRYVTTMKGGTTFSTSPLIMVDSGAIKQLCNTALAFVIKLKKEGYYKRSGTTSNYVIHKKSIVKAQSDDEYTGNLEGVFNDVKAMIAHPNNKNLSSSQNDDGTLLFELKDAGAISTFEILDMERFNSATAPTPRRRRRSRRKPKPNTTRPGVGTWME